MNDMFFRVFLRRQPHTMTELEFLLRQQMAELEASHAQQVAELEAKHAQQIAELEARNKLEMVDQSTTTDTPEDVWNRNFSGWTATNLQTEGVLPVTNSDFSFVLDEHPVIYILEKHQDMIGGNIRKMPKVDSMWYKISNDTLVCAIHKLRKEMSFLHTSPLSPQECTQTGEDEP